MYTRKDCDAFLFVRILPCGRIKVCFRTIDDITNYNHLAIGCTHKMLKYQTLPLLTQAQWDAQSKADFLRHRSLLQNYQQLQLTDLSEEDEEVFHVGEVV